MSRCSCLSTILWKHPLPKWGGWVTAGVAVSVSEDSLTPLMWQFWFLMIGVKSFKWSGSHCRNACMVIWNTNTDSWIVLVIVTCNTSIVTEKDFFWGPSVNIIVEVVFMQSCSLFPPGKITILKQKRLLLRNDDEKDFQDHYLVCSINGCMFPVICTPNHFDLAMTWAWWSVQFGLNSEISFEFFWV